jgi:hypothetical protein
MRSDRHHPLQKEDAQVVKSLRPWLQLASNWLSLEQQNQLKNKKYQQKNTDVKSVFFILTVDFYRF